MDAGASLTRLLAVLAERDIGLGYDDLAWLFDSPQSRDAMIFWVHEYLSPATLLTPEELEIHATIPQTLPDAKASTEHDTMPRPFEETDFETSILSLESSTAAIEKQCMVLEAQREALKKLQMQNRQSVTSLPDSDRKRQSRARAKVQLDLETGELTDSIQQRLGTAQRHAETTIGSLSSSSQRQLDRDDRLLDGLQKVMSRLGPLDPSAKRVPDFDTLARALVKLESKIVKDRTNAIYLAALQQGNKQSSGVQTGAQQDGDVKFDQEALALTEELNSLITEVDSVLEMTINNQYRTPIVDALKQSDAQSRRQQHQWLVYVKTTLGEMAQRLQDVAACTHDTTAYASAINRVSDALAETLPPPTQPRPKLERNQSSRTQSSKKLFKPFLQRTNSHANKDPAVEMLGYHGVRIPAESLENQEAVSSALRAAVQERQSRLQSLQKSTEQSVVAQVGESINIADGQLQNLLQVLYAYTPYGTLNLADKDAKDRIEKLERDIAGLADGMKRMDVDRLAEVEESRLIDALGE